MANSTQFKSEISNITIDDDESTISVDKACRCIRTKIENDPTLPGTTQLDIDDIIRLLSFVLSNSFFVYNNTTYEQIHGCATGSPVSAIVANLCMEVIEEQAIRDATSPPKVWKQFVDDCFSIIKKTNISCFPDILNSIDPHIDFTIENEKVGKIAFLDTLISRNDGY